MTDGMRKPGSGLEKTHLAIARQLVDSYNVADAPIGLQSILRTYTRTREGLKKYVAWRATEPLAPALFVMEPDFRKDLLQGPSKSLAFVYAGGLIEGRFARAFVPQLLHGEHQADVFRALFDDTAFEPDHGLERY